MKRNYWPLFFIGIFSFVFAMIVWTIMSASKVPINKDETFMSSYYDVDQNYNKIVASNFNFEKKYDFKLTINNNEFPLTFNDMFLAQRVIEEKSNHKDIFKLGQNEIKFSVKDRINGNQIDSLDIKIRVSRPTSHDNTQDYTIDNFIKENAIYKLNTNLPLKGNWNITGQVKIGNDIGYFYIKSNAI